MKATISPPSSASLCRVCGVNDYHQIFNVREMMFGTRQEFEYIMCKSCGCLQIAEIPEDISQYYPQNYYSHQIVPNTSSKHIIRKMLERQLIKTALFQRGFKLSNLAKKFVKLPNTFFEVRPQSLIRAGVTDFRAAILDIGCGSQAKWLQNLRKLGFSNLLGIDPFIESDFRINDIPILRIDASSFANQSNNYFNLITLNHSLEHIPDQLGLMVAIRALLAPTGTCIIRIPTVSSLAWDTYGVNWVELDAPRHFYLHSKNSLQYLASKVGLVLFDIQYDTTAFEFYGSEQYAIDIPLTSPQSLWVNSESKIFSYDKQREFEEKAEKVNAEGTAGRAVFFFRHAEEKQVQD